jgi:dihydropteroate synthase
MFTLNCKGRLLSLAQPVVMGIINITPDSFYSSSRHLDENDVILKAGQMLDAGAMILDIGAQSTRPGSDYLDADSEWSRLSTILPALHGHFPQAIISIDTFHHQVALNAVHEGASIINDISGGWLDDKMIATVALLGVPFVCMHMKGTPQTMHTMTTYNDIMTELAEYFKERLDTCNKAGIRDVIIDPGIGFAKTINQNFEVLKQLELLKLLDTPVLLGVSRKSMITKTLGRQSADALIGTTVLNTVGLMHGANILRVHDVQEAADTIKLLEKLK